MYPGSTSPGLLINVILCFEAKPDRGKTNPAHWLGKFKAIPVLISSTSFEGIKASTEELMSYPISESCFRDGTVALLLVSCISISIFLFNGNLSLMNIRDYLFIRKAKSSNKIKILDVLGFESDTTLIQTPDIIKEMDNLKVSSELEVVDEEIEAIEIGQQLINTDYSYDQDFQEQTTDDSPNTETFVPLNITTQIRKIWTDLEKRRQWVRPSLLIVIGIFIISSISIFFINSRNEIIASETLSNSISENTNIYIENLPELLAVATNPFYSRYDVSNASADLQIIETSLIQYQSDIIDREVPNRTNIEDSLNQLFNIVEKLDQLITYRIMHSEILIYEDTLNIDENTLVDDLANELSLIGAKSNLNGDTLPTIDEFTDHKQLVNSALITAQDLHGRLVASLRNNETEVANTLISAIELNKKSEISFFNDSLLNFQSKYESILENIEKLP